MNAIFESAYRAWSAASSLRERRLRFKNYTYGDQWCDIVSDAGGRKMREDELLRATGGKPLSNNLIRQLVKTVVGRYRTRAAEESLYTGADIASLATDNSLAELDSRLLEEFLISGCAIQRITRERRLGGFRTWVDNVDPRMFFVNAFKDPRGWDIDLIGMLHDMSIAEITNRFAGGNAERAATFRQLYATLNDAYGSDLAVGERSGNEDFFRCHDAYRCRAIEIWTLDSKPREGGCADLDFLWHCRWFAPDGTLLGEYDSPYGHTSHPFVVKYYPLTDGEVHPFVEDVIDSQRYINRLIVTIDKIMSTSAKGVLLFPLAQMTDHMRWEDITRVWARSDGVIPISGKGDKLPQQVMTNTADTGAYQLLQVQLKLFEDISGVGDALLGHSAGTAKGAQMLDTQVRNATIALADIFDTFTALVESRNQKALRA